MRTRQPTATTEVEVVTHGHVPQRFVEYARDKIADLARYTGEPIPHLRLTLAYAGDPAVSRPARAQANLDLNGRLLRGEVVAASLREAVDLLQARLRHRLSRMALHWEARRGGRPVPAAHEWRHDTPTERRGRDFPRPPGQRLVVRHRAYEPARATPDEAVFDMEHLGYDFHLFRDERTGQDAVVYRAGTGYRMAWLTPDGAPGAGTAVPLTVSPLPAPRLTVRDAISRLNLTGQPFLFFADAASGRGRLLYHRYDGHYGLLRPAA